MKLLYWMMLSQMKMDETALEVRSDELATINYDPTLDLRDYKYPELHLLENTW
jgi:hypothetical protein